MVRMRVESRESRVESQQKAVRSSSGLSTLDSRLFRRGIGRLESLVVIVMVIFVLVTVPKWVLHNRQEARKEQKMYHFRRLGQAINQYYDAYRSYPVLPKSVIRK